MNEENYKEIVASILIDIESIKFSFANPYTLTSGQKSPVYVDCRKIISFVKERNQIINFAKKYIEENIPNYDLLAGGETAGIPYASFLSQIMNKKMIYIRKEAKKFGKNKQIEGHFLKKQKVLLIEDLATDGGSKIIFIDAIKKADLFISDIFVIFHYDIFDINDSPLANTNVKIHSLCTWKDIINVISKRKLFSDNEIINLKFFLDFPEKWRQNWTK
tara:strand:+ start:1714 stop:2367 length:654 start_codon:yes stop_codon:yes gene_type:complete